MHSIKKKLIIAVLAAVTVLGALTACTKVTEKTEDGETRVEAEDLLPPEERDNGEEPEEADNREEPETAGADAQTPEQDSKEDGSASEAGEDRKFHYINEDKDLYGDICEIGDMQFTVTEIYMETGENGGEIMVGLAAGAEEESSKITVVYDENTTFVKQKIWDGGANHEEREGTAADLKKGLTAEMNGSYEGDVFHATEILIVEVILS